MISERTGCTISANASSMKSASRRSLRYFKGGQISVFTEIDSVKGGTASTGGRFLYILPAGDNMSIKKLGSFGMKVRDSAGLNWIYDENGNVKIEERCHLKVNKKITWENESTSAGREGGFFLKSCPNSVIVDVGFKRGGNAADNRKGLSQIRDSNGNQCSATNEELFNYIKEGREIQAVLKPSQSLYATLSRKAGCQDVNLSPLNTSSKGTKSGAQR